MRLRPCKPPTQPTTFSTKVAITLHIAWAGVRLLPTLLAVQTLLAQSPTISMQPQSQVVASGARAVFNVSVSGPGPYTYQWLLNGTNLPNNIISTVAGGGVGDYGPAPSALLSDPQGMAIDPWGNLFIADAQNNRVRKVNAGGVITTVAGGGNGPYSGDGGPAASAGLNYPTSVAVDTSGNLFIADFYNNRVRRVGANGIIITVAGNGTNSFSGDGSAALNASLNGPVAVAVDLLGNLFIADQFNNRIRKVNTNGIIMTVAGNGIRGYGGDGGMATNGSLYYPSAVAVDASGNLFITDADNSVIRKVSVIGIITTVAGTGAYGYSGDGGPATNASFAYLSGVALDNSGNLLTVDYGNERIRKVDTNGIITTLAGNGAGATMGCDPGNGGPATNACLNLPNGLATDAMGNVFIAERGDADGSGRIRVVLLSGIITAAAGNGSGGMFAYTGDGGAATNSAFAQPSGVVLDASGNVFIADAGNNLIRRINTSGVISTVAGGGVPTYSGDPGPESGAATNAVFSSPSGVALDAAGNLFIADFDHGRIRMVNSNGIFATVAGTSVRGYSGDGAAATNAGVWAPSGVAIDASGNLFIADQQDQRVRKVGTNGIITTFAGTGTNGFSGDNGAAINASLNYPTGVALDAAGSLFIGDLQNHRVRKVGANGIIATFAGTGTNGFSGDGGAATNAALYYPSGVAVDTAGNLFVAEEGNDRVRKVAADGTITTVAGRGTNYFSGDGGAATNASLSSPKSLATDAAGNLFIADYGNARVRKVTNAQRPILALDDVRDGNAGGYQLAVTGPGGSVTSSVASLGVIELSASVGGSVSYAPGANNSPGQTVALTAAPARYYTFLRWSHGNTNSVHAIVLGLTNSYTAIFTNPVPIDRYVVDGTYFALPSGSPLVLVGGHYGTNFAIPVFNGMPFLSNALEVVLQTTFQGGYVYYTLDGSAPDFSSTPYTNGSPFIVTNSLTVRAIAYKPDGTPSREADAVTIVLVPVYQLTDLTPGGGSVSLSPPGLYPTTSGLYLSNSTVTVTATASNGWTFLGWQGAASGTNNPTTVTMNSSNWVRAVFGTTISTNPPAGGSIVFSPAQGPYPYGSTVRLIGVPVDGKSFSWWFTFLTGPTNNPLDFVVTSNNPVVSAFFGNLAATNFTLTTFLNGPGTVTRNPGGNFYPSNASVQVTAVADPGFAFAGWSGDASGSGNPISVTLNTNKTITAAFSTPPTATITSPTNGSSFTAPTSVPITVLVASSNGTAFVDFYGNASFLGRTTGSPYALTWTNPPVGTNLLTVVATDNLNVSSTSAAVAIIVKPPPGAAVFAFTSASYQVAESAGSVAVTLTNGGDLSGSVSYQTVDGTAHGGTGFSGDYTSLSGSTALGGHQTTNLSLTILDNYLNRADVQFQLKLLSPSSGAALGSPSIATITIYENDVGDVTNRLLAYVVPTNQPAMSASLSVTVGPPAAAGKWRFPWDLSWRDSGQTASNLVQGNYDIQFRNQPGWLVFPQGLFSIQVTNGGTTSIATNVYYPTSVPDNTNGIAGSLTVNLGTTPPNGAGWRFVGDTAYLPAGSTNLVAGTYLIEFKGGFSGRSTPPNGLVQVFAGQPTLISVSYPLSASPGGAALPGPVAQANITDYANYPFGYNGQLQTDVGYGSGVAARQNVVLTAAHLVFNDQTLSFASQAYWSFQQETGSFQPQPLLARGWLVRSGYLAQRTNELPPNGTNAPSQLNIQSSEFDMAALYFLSPAGRTGYGGYLGSDIVPHPWLTDGSRLKMLVGYPVDGSQFGDASITPGKLYSTPLSPVASTFSLVSNHVYTADWLLSYPGNSGGPVYVQFTNNYYYPVVVYLGTLQSGGSYLSVVRAIDSDVVSLIGLAASQGSAGTNNSGGGVITFLPNPALSAANPAYIQVVLGPPAAVQAGAGWRVQGDSAYGYASNAPYYTRAITTNGAALEFANLAGWTTPTNRTVPVFAGLLNVISNQFYTHLPIRLGGLRLLTNGTVAMTLQGVSNKVYTIQVSSNLINWADLRLLTNAGATNVFTNPPVNGTRGFYRAREQP